MTTITLPRATVEQALEALENCSSEYGHRCNRCDSEVDEGGKVASALRAALAQQDEPMQEPDDGVCDGLRGGLCIHQDPNQCDRQRDCPAAQQAEPGEPVAWIQPDHLQKARVAPFLCRVEPTQRCADFVPLYLAPPKAEPVQEPVAWLDPWTRNNVTTDYDAYGKHGIPLYTAPPQQAEPVEPVAWECKAGGLKPLTQRQYDAQTANIRRHYTRIAPPQRLPLTEEVAGLTAQRDALLEALRMWLHLHEAPAGYEGKYGKALDAAIAAQQVKIDAAANAARAAIKAVEEAG